MLKILKIMTILMIFLVLFYPSPQVISETISQQEFFIHKYRDYYSNIYFTKDSTNKDLNVQLNITNLNDAKIYLLYTKIKNNDNSLSWVIFRTYDSIGTYSEIINASELRIEIVDNYYEEKFTNRSAQGNFIVIDANLNEVLENNSFILGQTYPETQNIYSRNDHGTWNYNVSVILENITVVGGLLDIDFYWWGGLDSGGDRFQIVENDYLDEWKVSSKTQSAHLNIITFGTYSYAYAQGWYTVIDHGELSTAVKFEWFSAILLILTLIFFRKLKKI